MKKYASKASTCAKCAQSHHGLPEKTPSRPICRWEPEDLVEDHKQRIKSSGRQPKCNQASLVEHPVGTLKGMMGWRHFLRRGIEKVRAEFKEVNISF